jgi:hypothetical protein
MTTRRHLPLLLALALIFALLLTLAGAVRAAGPTASECALAGIKNPAQLASFIGLLQKAIKNEDKAAVAAMVEYPLRVETGGTSRTIEDKAAFVEHYDTIMTKVVREAVLGQGLEGLTVNRRGVDLGEGRVQLSVVSEKLCIESVSE